MTIASSSNRYSSWKDYFLKSKNISYSNLVLEKIRNSVDPSRSFTSSVVEISKNPGITFIALDASGEKLQLFHHVSVIGGSWTSDKEKLVGVLGSGPNVIPVQLIQNSIKDVKGKSFSFDQLADRFKLKEPLKSDRSAKSEFYNYNILPIPALLTQVFLGLDNTDPLSVTTAFFQAMYQFDNKNLGDEEEQDPFEDEQRQDDQSKSGDSKTSDQENSHSDEELQETSPQKKGTTTPKNLFSVEFNHILQFCQLCHTKKMPSVLYTLIDGSSVQDWMLSVSISLGLTVQKNNKRMISASPHSSDESTHSQKVSRTDEHLLSTMLKIHESFDNNFAKSDREKEEKEPGFKRLEPHKKNLILNASATPPFDTQAKEPSEFYKAFLQKKTQFKAKEFLVHRLQVDNIALHPSSTFAAGLWNCDFLWLTPDLPSGVSIFFCPEISSLNSYEIEKDRNLALVDKIKPTDIDKISKEKFSLPETVMDMVWLTQNFHAVVSLCFGLSSHSAKFLKDWGNHMYSNRLMYKSLQASDNTFFAQVLFCIDRALQIHWKSCCECSDRDSVNDRVLLMSEKRDLIIQHNFTYNIPKVLKDKLFHSKKPELDVKDEQGKTNKHLGDNNRDKKNHFKSWKDIITDNDPKHAHWRLQDGENFSRRFYHNQRKCPKTKDGKLICMKLFIRGICDKTCTRAHKLSTEDEKAFDEFVGHCREGGAEKPDF